MKLSLAMLTQGRFPGKVFSISGPECVIGRDARCHLQLPTPLVSRRHCTLLIRENQAFVRDTESRCGTYLNYVLVRDEQELHNGDRLRFGGMEFQVLIEAVG
jgi:pSer/pThr/pTyr-binding forkhead associated (FHA) protein